MRQLWIIARHDLSLMLQSKQYWFLLLALPALIVYLVGLGAQGIARIVPTSIPIDVLDLDRSAASQALVAALAEANETLLVCPAYNDAADACALAGASLSSDLTQQRLAGERVFASVTIPQGFASALETGNETTLVFRPGAGLAAPEIAFAAVQNAVARLGGPLIAARLSTRFAESLGVETGPEFYAARYAEAEASWKPSPPAQVVAEFSRPNQGQVMGAQLMDNGFKISTPSIAAMFVMISILGMAQSLAEERLMGVLQRLGTMPVSKVQLLGGKLLATVLLGALQFGLLLTFGDLLGVDFGRDPWAAALVALGYVLAITAMALALATLARTPNQASTIATLAWMVLVPLGGGWWPLTFVPTWMQILGHLSPVAWCLDALDALIFYQGTFTDVLRPVGVLLLFAGVFFVFGVRNLDYRSTRGGDITKVLPYFGVQGERES
jgi:ABC-2 type transport system permease protein